MTVPAQHDEIGVSLMAQALVGSVMHFETVARVAHLTAMFCPRQRLKPSLLPPLGFEVLAVGELRPCPGTAARVAHAQLTGQHRGSSVGVLRPKHLAANITRPLDGGNVIGRPGIK